MRNVYVVMLMVLSLSAKVSIALEPVSVHTFGQAYTDSASVVVRDSSDNYYVGGIFTGTIDFDSETGVTTRTSDSSLGNNFDPFVAKYSSSGQLIWVSSCSGPSTEDVRSIGVDSNGNVYVTGVFSGTVDFDPGPGTSSLTSASSATYIWKLDSNGSFVWVKGLQGEVYFYSVALDAAGNLYTCGNFNGTVDFDPDAGTLNRTAVLLDAFVLKLDSSGVLSWLQCLTGDGNDSLTTVTLKGTNIYLAGSFTSSVIDFDPGVSIFNINNPSPGISQAFVWKLDTTGAFNSVAPIFTNADIGVYGMALDSNENVFLTGVFGGTTDFDPDAGVSELTGTINTDAFLLKLNSSGSFQWVQGVRTNGNNISISNATTDTNGNAYVIGHSRGQVKLQSDNTVLFDTGLNADTFCIKFDDSGSLQWAEVLNGGSNPNNAYGLSVLSNSTVIMAGQFYGTLDFDPRGTVVNRTSAGDSDMYVLRLLQTGVVDLNGSATGPDFSSSFNQHGPVSIVDSSNLTVKHEANGIVSALDSASVVISNPLNGTSEVLAADAGSTGIAISYNANTNTLSLTGASSLANYQQVLRTVTYNNTAPTAQMNFTTRVVIFTVNDGVSDSEAAVAQITMIPNQAPSVIAVAAPLSVAPGVPVVFSATGTDPENDTLTYAWTFGNGQTSSDQNPAHSYSEVSVFTATVTVTDPNGATGTASLIINVSKAPVVRLQTSDVVGFAALPFTFDASTSTDPENAIAFYDWNFGDGTPHGSGQVISKVYDNPGTYTVTLTITDSAGVSSSTTRVIEVLQTSQAGLFNGFMNYKVSWNRSVENKDSLTFTGGVNVGEDIVAEGTTVAVEIVGQRFNATLDRKLRDTTNVNAKWQVKANIRNQPTGTVTVKATIKKASLGAAFNQAGATVAGDPHDIVTIDIPVRLEIGARSFELMVPSDFKFSSNGTRARGDGASE